jgi:hypothetical protein
VEFGTVTQRRPASSGVGYIDVTFTSSITPTAGDLIVFANADGDSTITGTDVQQLGDRLHRSAHRVLDDGRHGVLTSATPAGPPGSDVDRHAALSFQVKEKMINDCWNAAG